MGLQVCRGRKTGVLDLDTKSSWNGNECQTCRLTLNYQRHQLEDQRKQNQDPDLTNSGSLPQTGFHRT